MLQFQLSLALRHLENYIEKHIKFTGTVRESFSGFKKSFSDYSLRHIPGIEGNTRNKIFNFSNFNQNRSQLQNIYWWGIAQSGNLNYWEDREQVANERKLPLFRHLQEFEDNLTGKKASSTLKKVGEFFSNIWNGDQRGATAETLNLDTNGIQNIPKPGDNGAIFQVQHRGITSRSNPQNFYNVPSADEIDPSKNAQWRARSEASGSEVVKSVKPYAVDQGLIPLPAPEGHSLSQVNLKDEKGRALVLGKDFDVYEIEGQNRYYAQMRSSKVRTVLIHSEFVEAAKKIPGDASRLANLDPARLAALTRQLREAGLTPLADAIDKELNKPGISVSKLGRIFADSSLYSYVPAKIKDLKKATSGPNPFTPFAKMINQEGIYCTQCSGADGLYRTFMENYFQGDPSIQIRSRLGFIPDKGLLTARNYHVKTEFLVNGISAEVVDTTPSKMDPRSLATFHPFQASSYAENEKPAPPTEAEIKARTDEYVEKVKAQKKAVVEDFKNAVAHLDRNEPLVRISVATNAVTDYLTGQTDFAKFKAALKDALPSYSHDYTNWEQAQAFLDKTMAEEIENLEKFTKQSLRSTTHSRYEHYLDTGLKRELQDLMRSLQQIPAQVGCAAMYRF